MTAKEKELLLKDLSARLPYGVNICIKYYDLQSDGELASRDIKLTAGNTCYCFDSGNWVDIKPYLRPMSSMTEEEMREFYEAWINDFSIPTIISIHPNEMDWLNAHYFDYRGLIEKGLALEAPEGMYTK